MMIMISAIEKTVISHWWSNNNEKIQDEDDSRSPSLARAALRHSVSDQVFVLRLITNNHGDGHDDHYHHDHHHDDHYHHGGGHDDHNHQGGGHDDRHHHGDHYHRVGDDY